MARSNGRDGEGKRSSTRTVTVYLPGRFEMDLSVGYRSGKANKQVLTAGFFFRKMNKVCSPAFSF